MPPEPLPWDRKDCFKERKHERSESLGSVGRWRDSSSSHLGPREFTRWGSADFRRPPGHGKQGAWHLFSEESGHGYASTRSGDRVHEDESCRLSVSRGDTRYGRSSRDNRGYFIQRDWRGGQSWKTSNGSPNIPGRQHDVNSIQRSVNDMLAYTSHSHSDFVNTWEKDQHDNLGRVSGLGTGQRCDKDNLLGSADWKPLKWNRSGSLSSRGSGLSHSSSSKSLGGVDSNEVKVDLQLKNVTPIQSPSGDASACVITPAMEETTSRKKPRLGWGEGLAKYEKKKVEGPDESVSRNGVAFSPSNAEAVHSPDTSLANKSPLVTEVLDCESPSTPSSVACSSSSGLDEKSFSKSANNDNGVSNLCGSQSPGPQNQLEGFSFNLEKLDTNSLVNVSSSLIELLQYDDPRSLDSSFERSTAINKLMVCKGDILKVLEMTESEIDLLETELKSLKSESGVTCPFPAASCSLPGEDNAKPCKEQGPACNMNARPAPLQIVSSGDEIVQKMPLCNGSREEVHTDFKGEDIDSPGTATSKFTEPVSLVKAVPSSEELKHGECSGCLDATQYANMEVKCSVLGSIEECNQVPACRDVSMLANTESGAPVSSDLLTLHINEDTLYNSILTSNKESATRAYDIFNKLLPSDQYKIDVEGSASLPYWKDNSLIKEKIAARKSFLRFKERAITLKFKAFQHLWKEDLRLLSIRRRRAKSQKKFESSLWIPHSRYQKYRSSIRSRFSSPVGNLSLVPTSEVIKFTSKLLLDYKVKLSRNQLKMPALILDQKEKMASRFASNNGLVEDPCTVEKESALINPWTREETEIFMDNLVTFGKDFRKIASFLDHKTTADCIDFYYKNHKSDIFEETNKKLNAKKLEKSYSSNTYMVALGKKWNPAINAASLDMLGAASVMAAHADCGELNGQTCSGGFFLGGYMVSKTLQPDDGILEKSSSFDALENERETAAADVLAGICGSMSSEAMSSCITSSVDPGEVYKEWKCPKVDYIMKRPLTRDVPLNGDGETCSDESCGGMDPSDWTDEEKSIFIQAVSSYGKDFAMISRCVRTRSRNQCKVFFSKARKCLGLDLIRPGRGNVGASVTDDANGGGSDMEDACVVESGLAVCSDKLGSKGDEDLQTDLNRSEENNGIGQPDHSDVEPAETLVSDAHQSAEKPGLAFDEGNNIKIKNGFDRKPYPVHALKTTVISTTLGRSDQQTHQGTSIVESVCVNSCPTSSNVVVETKAVTEDSTEAFENELSGEQFVLPEEILNNERNENGDAVTSAQSGLQCSVQDSNTSGNASHLAAGTKFCPGFDLNPEHQHQASLELDSMEKSEVISLRHECSFPNENSVSQDSAAVNCEKTVIEDRLSSTLDFQDSRDKQCNKLGSRDDHHQHLMARPSSNHAESSQILRGYPLQVATKRDMNGEISCGKLSEVQSLSKSDRNFNGRYVTQDCYLQKCNSSKPQCSASELSTSDYPRVHSRSLSDTEKPNRSNDFKLFGQILSHPSSLQKSNSNTHEKEEKRPHHPKFSSKSSNLKFSSHHSANGNSALWKFDRNNYLGLENLPRRSHGFWDRNRIRTGFSTLPDSAFLLAKYPAAFSTYPQTSSRIEQQPLQAVSVFPAREKSSSNGVVDYQVYRSRDGTKVQPFRVEMKQPPDIFTEMQRRNGFDPVGVPCNGVSDPVAAIKMQYAKTDPFGGQNGRHNQRGNLER